MINWNNQLIGTQLKLSKSTVILTLLFQNIVLAQVPTFIETPDIADHEEIIKYIKRNNDHESAFLALQRLIEPRLANNDWEKADQILQEIRPLFTNLEYPRDTTAIDCVLAIIRRPPKNVITKALPKQINTSADEYLPRLNLDGTVLFFTGDNRKGGEGEEDIFYSAWNPKTGRWKAAKQIGGSINTPIGNEGALAISPDGKTLLAFGTWARNDTKGNIYCISKTQHSWDQPVPLPNTVNSPEYEAGGFLTYDNKALLFTSTRPDNIGEFHPKGAVFNGDHYGNQDIYVSEREGDGWGPTINLGEVINTPYAEVTPFLHPDGVTLYFSSDGHPGLGRLDVFMAKRKSRDSWTEWEAPINLGKEINTPASNDGYFISPDGGIVYYTDQTKKFRSFQSDIYVCTLPRSVQPDPVTKIEGEVEDSDGIPVPDVEVSLKDFDSGDEIATTTTDDKGKFEFIAPDSESPVVVEVEDSTYFPTASEPIDLTPKSLMNEVTPPRPLPSNNSLAEQATSRPTPTEPPRDDESTSSYEQPSISTDSSDEEIPGESQEILESYADLKDYLEEDKRHSTLSDLKESSDVHEDDLDPLPDSISATSDFIWPLRSPDPNFEGAWAMSAHVDHDSEFPQQLTDYKCGQRTYDLANGYNHRGTDIYPWPFPWFQMDSQLQHVIAIREGIIIKKDDGNPDRNCKIDATSDWNAVFILHPDTTMAWYGHLKTGSLTSKSVGDWVNQGEYLGVVGSSGASTGPHLHFELYDKEVRLIDPFKGECDDLGGSERWFSEKSYWDPNINLILTHSERPFSIPCPSVEVRNVQDHFMQGDSVLIIAYYREFSTENTAQYKIIQPDGLVLNTWSDSSSKSTTASWSGWWIQLGVDALPGKWTVEGFLNGRSQNHFFYVDELPQDDAEKPFADRGTPKSHRLDESLQTFPQELLQNELDEPVCTDNNNIYFEFNSANLNKTSNATVERIAHHLKGNRNRALEIYGHTDSQGSFAYNMKLSKMRAQSVKDALIQYGIPEYAVDVKARGEEDLAIDDSGEIPWRSRRVEICILR